MQDCQICLCDVEPDGLGLQAPSQWPCCARCTHLGCLADLCCTMPIPRCPNCRATFTDQRRELWFVEACQRHGISVEGQLAEQSPTTAVVVRNYTDRTFSNLDVPPPPAPACVHALCCRRLGGPPDFPELSCRRMDWAPVACRNEAGAIGSNHITSWQEQWLCPRCSSAVDLATAVPPSDVQQMPPTSSVGVRQCSRGRPVAVMSPLRLCA